MYKPQQYEDLIGLMLMSMVDVGDHFLDIDYDGDGWNEPFVENYECTCGEWSVRWYQTDPECKDRPDPLETLFEWRSHMMRNLDYSEQDLDELWKQYHEDLGR